MDTIKKTYCTFRIPVKTCEIDTPGLNSNISYIKSTEMPKSGKPSTEMEMPWNISDVMPTGLLSQTQGFLVYPVMMFHF